MINMFNQENFLMKNKIDNTIEWANKRLQLMGEGEFGRTMDSKYLIRWIVN